MEKKEQLLVIEPQQELKFRGKFMLDIFFLCVRNCHFIDTSCVYSFRFILYTATVWTVQLDIAFPYTKKKTKKKENRQCDVKHVDIMIIILLLIGFFIVLPLATRFLSEIRFTILVLTESLSEGALSFLFFFLLIFHWNAYNIIVTNAQ